MMTSPKIVSLKTVLKRVAEHRGAGRRVVFTNGCFDILHAGHVRYLAAAKSEGEILVVGLNSDISVKAIKGEKRPIVSQDLRAVALAGFESVDYVVIFNEPDPHGLIGKIMPDVLVKGADWAQSDIVGSDIVRQNGGRVVRVPLVPNISTSQIIERILEIYRANS